jgi:hypothetical protein
MEAVRTRGDVQTSGRLSSVRAMVPALRALHWPKVRDHVAMGASTGYMSGLRGDWLAMVRLAADESIIAVELSALSEPELPALLAWLDERPTLPFEWIAAHGPTKQRQVSEQALVAILKSLARHVEVVVLHQTRSTMWLSTVSLVRSSRSRTWTRESSEDRRLTSSKRSSPTFQTRGSVSTSHMLRRLIRQWPRADASSIVSDRG